MSNQPSPAAMRAAQQILVKFVTNTPSNPAFSQTRIGMAELIDREFWPVVEALRRISYAKADQLDHSIDVGIIERAARTAKQALAALEAR